MADDDERPKAWATDTVTRTTTSLSLYPGDIELLRWITEYLGCSQSEAVRTAVRAYAATLAEIDKRKNK